MTKKSYTPSEKVQLFLECVEKLKANSLIREDKLKRVTSLNTFDEFNGWKFELLDANREPVNMESFTALATTFRQIYMKKEPSYILEVYSHVCDAIQIDQRQRIQAFGHNWELALQEDTRLIGDDGTFIKVDEALRNWLYGGAFHTDKSERDFTKKWGIHLEAEIVFIVNFLCQMIFWFDGFLRDGLKKKLFNFPN